MLDLFEEVKVEDFVSLCGKVFTVDVTETNDEGIVGKNDIVFEVGAVCSISGRVVEELKVRKSKTEKYGLIFIYKIDGVSKFVRGRSPNYTLAANTMDAITK